MTAALILALLSQPVLAPPHEECPEYYALCLTEEKRLKVIMALEELQDIRDSKAELEFIDPVVIIRDWEDRVYVNGGQEKPVRLRLHIGKTVDRSMEATIPVQLFYREKPPDPMFRLRLRAQAGILAPSIKDSFKDGWDAGVGLDFFHVSDFNISLNAGVRSVGAGVGWDVTKNFGPVVGYALKYDGLESSGFFGVYFSLY